MSDWFDSEDQDTSEAADDGPLKRRKPPGLELGVVRPPPRSPLLINPDGTDKVFDDGLDRWIKDEEELNKRHRSPFGELSDDHQLRDETPDDEQSE